MDFVGGYFSLLFVNKFGKHFVISTLLMFTISCHILISKPISTCSGKKIFLWYKKEFVCEFQINTIL